MQQYLDLVRHIRDNGVTKTDRTGVGTTSVFGYQMRFNLNDGFPMMTTKRVPFKSMFAELIWFLNGSTNNNVLNELGSTIWDEWANLETGDLGPIYGKQWRSWEGANGETFDQITNVIDEIKKNPDSRRLVVSAWNVAELDDMALNPCHALFQFYVADGKLSCQLYQRSADVFLGVPFNIASYALLTHLVARVTDLEVGEFVHTLGDAHLYSNHSEQVEELLSREPRQLPTLHIADTVRSVIGLNITDAWLEGYDPLPTISAPVAV